MRIQRFSIFLGVCLIACLCAALVGGSPALNADAESSASDESIQGLWFCTGSNGVPVNSARRTVLLIRDEEFLILRTELSASTATFRSRDAYSEVDIERFDGKKQLGIYKLDGALLHMVLGDPGKPRPDGFQALQRYSFSRVPTSEGADVLRRLLADDSIRASVGEPYERHQKRVHPPR